MWVGVGDLRGFGFGLVGLMSGWLGAGLRTEEGRVIAGWFGGHLCELVTTLGWVLKVVIRCRLCCGCFAVGYMVLLTHVRSFWVYLEI